MKLKSMYYLLDINNKVQ